MDFKLELVVVPVSDVDGAKTFYSEQTGFNLLVDHRAGDDFRVVQLTPPDSARAIALMRNTAAPGSVQGLHLVVSDIDAAHAELVGRGGATLVMTPEYPAGPRNQQKIEARLDVLLYTSDP